MLNPLDYGFVILRAIAFVATSPPIQIVATVIVTLALALLFF